MTKASPKEKSAKNPKHKMQLRSSGSKYSKPATLAAQLRYTRSSSSKPRVDTGKQLGSGSCRKDHERSAESSAGASKTKSPLLMSPVNLIRQSGFVRTPKTPQADVCISESRLESLPMDLLVKILCYLHHDQLKAVFHVSQRVRNAVLLARQHHFNYTTPDCSRQEMLNTMTPRLADRYPFVRRGGNGFRRQTPHTPKALRQAQRPPRPTREEMQQFAADLFKDSVLPSPRSMVPSVLGKPICKPVASHRVLFYEDELCQAVAQNKLL